MALSIARTSNKIALEVNLCAEIEFCASTYCGATNINSEMSLEATTFVTGKYYFLGVDEIRSAFRLAAAKELRDLKTGFPIDIKAYAGIFTIETLGTILDAYVNYRKRIEYTLSKQMEEIKEAEAEAERKERQQTPEFQKQWLDNLIGFLKRKTHLCAAMHYEELSQAGLITVENEEKREYMERAKTTLKIRLAAEIENEGNYFEQVLLRKMAQNEESGDYQQKLISEAKRLIVKDFINTLIWCEGFMGMS